MSYYISVYIAPNGQPAHKAHNIGMLVRAPSREAALEHVEAMQARKGYRIVSVVP